ncbi:MAG TPA: hypothetical protein ENH81_03180 [Thermococcus sp.]|nr:hypothetical protein [Thermococcus sp.]
MRRLFYALPFLIFGFCALMIEPTISRLIVVGLAWLTFLIEYRYGGESREGEELVALGVSTAVVLMPLHRAVSLILAVSMFVLELAALFIKFKLKG